MEKLYIKLNGFGIEENIEQVDTASAEDFLLTQQQYYTYAKRVGNKFELVSHAIRCPECGHRVPSYEHFIYSDKKYTAISNDELRTWLYGKSDCRNDEDGDNVLYFNTPKFVSSAFECNNCHHIAPLIRFNKKKEYWDADIVYNDGVLQIVFDINDNDDVCVSWQSPVFNKAAEYPMHEILEFNFNTGETTLRYNNCMDKLIAKTDVVNDITRPHNPAFDTFLLNDTFKQTVISFFEKVHSGALPFSYTELNLKTFSLLTQFIGYDREFYDSIPYRVVEQDFKVDETFSHEVEGLRYASNIPDLYATTSLPQVKSIKRIIYKEPALLFYREELEKLWSIINDGNVFYTLLDNEDIYEILALLHMYPGTMQCFREYAENMGAISFVNVMEEELPYFFGYALAYAGFSTYQKQLEQKRWEVSGSNFLRENYYAYISSRAPMRYSKPVFPKEEYVPPVTINGYTFTWLRNTQQYYKASLEMRGGMDITHTQAVLISYNSLMCGLVTLQGRIIWDFSGCSFTPVKCDSNLYRAFEEWVHTNRFFMTDNGIDIYELTDEDDLPF